MMRNNLQNRIISFLAVVFIISVIFLSSLYIIEHADHQCTGEDCPVCVMIDQCLDTLKQIGGIVTAFVCAVALNICIILIKNNYTYIAFANSLISQKVRMNN